MASYRDVQEAVRNLPQRWATSDIFRGAVKVGTVLFFEYASAFWFDNEWLVIFTEHHGEHIYNKDDLIHGSVISYEKVYPNKKWQDLEEQIRFTEEGP